MGRGIHAHGLWTGEMLAVACPESPEPHDAAGAVFHPLFGCTTPGAPGLHGSFIVASRCRASKGINRPDRHTCSILERQLFLLRREVFGLEAFGLFDEVFKKVRLAPQFFTSIPYSISASVISETAKGLLARMV